MIGNITYRLFIKEVHLEPDFQPGHYNNRVEAVADARRIINDDPNVQWINVYCQEHVKRFARTEIIEEGIG